MNKSVEWLNGLLTFSPPEITSMLTIDKKKTTNKNGIQTLVV